MKNFINYTIDKQANCLEALKKPDQEKSNQTLFVLDEKDSLSDIGRPVSQRMTKLHQWKSQILR